MMQYSHDESSAGIHLSLAQRENAFNAVQLDEL